MGSRLKLRRACGEEGLESGVGMSGEGEESESGDCDRGSQPKRPKTRQQQKI